VPRRNHSVCRIVHLLDLLRGFCSAEGRNGNRGCVEAVDFLATTDAPKTFLKISISMKLNMITPQARLVLAGLGLAMTASVGFGQGQVTGPSTTTTPYSLIKDPTYNTITSLFTVNDAGAAGNGYEMVGIPDGLGAYDNGDGTFTVLMNHELGSGVGVARAHGAIGAFVSKLTIDKTTLAVTAGSDLITQVSLAPGGVQAAPSSGAGFIFNRFCSADLPAQSAFQFGALGTSERIFMNGEESGNEGRAFGTVVSTGVAYELARLGKFSWENSIASPYAQAKTIVMGTDDSTPGQVYMYVGTKTNTGLDIDKAGLTNGNLYGTVVTGMSVEGGAPATSATFTMFNHGDVSATTGTALNTSSNTNNVTQFARPEDGAWDPVNPNKFYFVTTGSAASGNTTNPVGGFNSRLWVMNFTDIANPEVGGTIDLLLDGSEGGRNFDNITVDRFGNIMIQEDAGNVAHLGKTWSYNPTTDSLTQILSNDPAQFLSGGANYTGTQDEEASGIIDITSIMQPNSSLLLPGEAYYLASFQNHLALGGAPVEGGQLQLIHLVPEPSRALLLMGGLFAMIVVRRRK
jgi:hypothetical protein